MSTMKRYRAPFSALARRMRCTSAERRTCLSGSPSSAKPRSGSGARRIEQRVVVAATLHALALLSGVSPEQGLVENLLGNLHDVCVSSTVACGSRRMATVYPRKLEGAYRTVAIRSERRAALAPTLALHGHFPFPRARVVTPRAFSHARLRVARAPSRRELAPEAPRGRELR